jgi:hypothetical protein
VPAHSAVRVDDDLAPREPGVALRPADDETTRRVDVVGGVLPVEERFRQRGLDDLGNDRLANPVLSNGVGVLR